MKKLLKKYGATTDDNTDYFLNTKYGTLVIIDLNDNTSIPMFFQSGFNLEQFLIDSNDHTINKNSFKWNLHSTDKKFNLERLEQRLKWLSY